MLTGYVLFEKANGKSLLNSWDKAVWGDDIFGNVSMSSFQQMGNANNDNLYQARNARAVNVVENSQTGVMNEVNDCLCLSLLDLLIHTKPTLLTNRKHSRR